MQNMHNELYSFHLDLLVLVYVYVCIFIQFFLNYLRVSGRLLNFAACISFTLKYFILSPKNKCLLAFLIKFRN